MNTMSCDDFTDLVDLYAAGCLEKAEADALRSHIAEGCEQCTTRLVNALAEAALISSSVPQVEPSKDLRNRVVASVNAVSPPVVMPRRKSFFSLTPWLVAAAALLVMIFGIGYEEKARRAAVSAQTSSLEAAARANAERTAEMLDILQAPGTKQVSFDIDKANLPHGSLFIHKQLGVAMVVAHLPPPPRGWKYESWIVPKSGAPQPVESFAIDNDGFAFTLVKGPVDVSQWSAMAVSIEPENSNPVKPTKVIFASPV